jgi:hypothetical protein
MKKIVFLVSSLLITMSQGTAASTESDIMSTSIILGSMPNPFASDSSFLSGFPSLNLTNSFANCPNMSLLGQFNNSNFFNDFFGNNNVPFNFNFTWLFPWIN